MVEGDGLERHRQLRRAKLILAVVAGDHVLHADGRLGGEPLPGAGLDGADLRVHDLEAQQHVAEELALIGVGEALEALELADLADVVDEHAHEQEIAVEGRVERSHAVGEPQQVDDVIEQAARVGVVVLHARGCPLEGVDEGLVGDDLVGEGLERCGANRAEDRGQLRLQPHDVVLREHLKLALVDRPRVDPIDRRDDQLQRTRVELRVPLDADIVAVLERVEVVVGSIPEPAGDHAALVGEFHL